jgi:V/A-type H+-transporting ATPase subunit I
MAIVPLDKITLYGTLDQKDSVLDRLQELGCMHLIDLQNSTTHALEIVSKDAREALRYLQAAPSKRHATQKRWHYDREQVVDEALRIKRTRIELFQERDYLQAAIEDLEPWGDFRVDVDLEARGIKLWFYVIPRRRLEAVQQSESLWHIARLDPQNAYVVIVAAEQPTEIGTAPIALDRRPLRELKRRLGAVEEELDELLWQRVSLTRWRELLRFDLDAADDLVARRAAAAGTLDTDPLFALQGWVPRAMTEPIRQLADEHEMAISVEPSSQDELPPTLLQNPTAIAGAEGCVTFYITPNYHTWDPTPIVYLAFSFFFAMIVADAGYGFIMALLLVAFRGRLNRSAGSRRLRNLIRGIVALTIVYGVLVGSYFGISPPRGSWLARLQLQWAEQPLVNNQQAMMILAVSIGVLHLVAANLIRAWKDRRTTRSLGRVGWAVVMIGGFATAMGTMTANAPVEHGGELLLAIGMILVVLFSSDEPLWTRSIKSHLRRMFDGAMQVTNLPKAFGDILSYLRLFALGLASAQLAVTFNGLSQDAAKIGGVGTLLAILIAVFGHGINFVLAIMGGVVHGLRLNCIEFFNWSLTEEGRPFQPFRKKVNH